MKTEQPTTLDNHQKRAIEILEKASLNPDWIVEYFSETSTAIWQEIQERYHRFVKIRDVNVYSCGSCKKPFDWSPIEGYAWAGMREAEIRLEEETNGVEDFTANLEFADFDFTDSFWVIEDDIENHNVLCPKCRHKAEARYLALKQVYRSAFNREKSEEEKREQRLAEEREQIEEELNMQEFGKPVESTERVQS